jgi:hypothetical protein
MKTETKATPAHTPTPWEVHGPVKEGTLNLVDGKTSKMRDVGYGIRGVEPKMFGGTVIGIEKGLTKANAAFIVRAVNAHDDLVSSASDLLKVLQSRFMRTGCSVIEEAAIKCLRAAIAKAQEGK